MLVHTDQLRVHTDEAGAHFLAQSRRGLSLVVDRRLQMGDSLGDVMLALLGLMIAIRGRLLRSHHHFTPSRMRGIERTIDAALNATVDAALARLIFSRAQLVEPEVRQ